MIRVSLLGNSGEDASIQREQMQIPLQVRIHCRRICSIRGWWTKPVLSTTELLNVPVQVKIHHQNPAAHRVVLNCMSNRSATTSEERRPHCRHGQHFRYGATDTSVS